MVPDKQEKAGYPALSCYSERDVTITAPEAAVGTPLSTFQWAEARLSA
jgi:hypothetical protein